ncbi:MAG: ATP-binding protein [Bacteroidales bacterium]|nr:ATP-binding protein [Bacteroidales bacterium]
MNQIYNRKYVADIVKLSTYFPVIGIIGARQVGKTTLVRMLENEFSKKMIFIDLELLSDYNRLDKPELYLSRFSNQCVVIDEVQIKPDLFPILRAISDRTGDACQFIVTGSASPDLLRQSTESLAGRIAYIEVSPFSLDELPDTVTQDQHWFRGGFPKSLFAPDEFLSRNWIENFIKTYIERDLQILGLRTDVLLLRRLWIMLSHMHGNVVNYSSLSTSLGVSVNTVRHYIDFFEQAFLVKRIQPYFTNIKKRLVKSPKIFLTDTGILHSLLGIKSIDELFGHPSIGNSWEGYCVNQIISTVKTTYDAFFFRTHDGSECDLVLTKGMDPIYAIEIKFSDAPKLSRGNILAFRQINAKNNVVIVPSGENYPLRNNIEVFNLQDFVSLIQNSINNYNNNTLLNGE